MPIQTILEKIGLNDRESAVYLACLEFGAKPASVIAKRVSLNRASVYGILQKLIDKGFVSQFRKSSTRFFSATPPEHLLYFFEQKKKEIDADQKKLEEFLPDLNALANANGCKPQIRFYEGAEGIEKVMDDTLNSKTPICCISSIDGWLRREITKKYMARYVSRRIYDKKIPIRVITFDTPLGRKYADEWCPDRENIEMTHNRWFPKHIKNFNNEINIYDNKVSIVALGEHELNGIVIESQEYADTMRVLFEFCWHTALPSRWE